MDIKEQIEQLLDKEIRPMVQSHGGDVKLSDYNNGVALVSLSGACAGCPSADLSTRGMIEEALTANIPEVKSVEIDFTVPEDMLEFARKILRGEINVRDNK